MKKLKLLKALTQPYDEKKNNNSVKLYIRRIKMNHEQLVKHYAELLEAKDRGEQWAIEEYDKPMNQEQYAAFFDAFCDRLGIEPIPDDHPLYTNAKPFVIIGNRGKQRKDGTEH